MPWPRPYSAAQHAPGHPHFRYLQLALIVLVILTTLPVGGTVGYAQTATPATFTTCASASEPNDLPENALELGPGAACATSENVQGGQDLYRWTVMPGQAATRWTVGLSAIPGQVGLIEIYEVVTDSAGTVTEATKHISVLGEVGEATFAPNLLLAPGTWYIGVAASGPGAYQLEISEGDPFPTVVGVPGESAIATGPLEVTGTVDSATSRIAWTLTDSESRLDLRVQGPVGASLTWTLADSTGLQLFTSAVASSGISTLPDLGLPPGNYSITLSTSEPEPVQWIVSTTQGSARSDTTETEPNDATTSAMPIAWDGDAITLNGRLATRPSDEDLDFYRLTIDAAHMGRLTDIRLLWQSGRDRALCLLDAAGNQLRCSTGGQGLALNDLVLGEGDYLLSVVGVPDTDDPYVLKINVTGEAASGFEAEPNDDMAHASPLAPETDGWTIDGRLQGNEVDYFRMTVTGEPQLWQIRAEGPGIASLNLLDANGNWLLQTGLDPNGVAVIYDAFLLPGDHGVLVSGEGSDYTVHVTPLGKPDPLFEHEPNDTLDRSQPTRLLEERTGRLASSSDWDWYRFSLQNDTFVEVRLDVPADAKTRLALESGGFRPMDLTSPEPGADIVWRGMLAHGNYVVWLTPATPSAEPYRLTFIPLNPFTTPDDLEPNDTADTAVPMPESLQVAGALDVASPAGDVDWYTIPPFDRAGQVTIDYSPEVMVELLAAADGVNPSMPLPSVLGTEADGMLVDVPANTPLRLRVSGRGSYEIAISNVDLPQPFIATPTVDTPSSLTATLDVGEVQPAAFWTTGQVVNGELTMTNDGSSPVDLTLSAKSGEAHWRVEFDSDSLPVDPGETVTLPVRVHVAPDTRAEDPVFVAIEVTDGTLTASAMALVIPSRTAPPLNVEAWSPVPPEIQGGINVAWSGLGAVPVAVDETTAMREAPLYDEMLTVGYGYRAEVTALPVELTVDLAGDEPIPVAAIVLFPLAFDGPRSFQLREFELELSLDGQTFTPALAGELTTLGEEQIFVLDQPVDARFARLRVRSSLSVLASEVFIGEWKVIADPAWVSPSSPFNLADPAIGGHVVDIQPPLPNAVESQMLLTADGARQFLSTANDSAPSWTIGFHHDRAALVTSLEWIDPPGSEAASRIDTVTIEVSTGSPIGPWTSLGAFALQRDATGIATVSFDAPIWARFVRVSAVPAVIDPTTTPVPGQELRTWELPDQVIVRERPIAADYRSILGEWGTDQISAIYEQLVAPVPVTLDPDAGNDSASATTLELDAPHTDSAAVTVDEDWYEVTIPDGDGTLEVSLEGIPALGVVATLQDEDGEDVPFTITSTGPSSSLLTAVVQSGATYRLHVTQPPTSVVFAFDTSLSIGPFEPTVYQGLTRFAGDVLPGREAVNILPFGEDLLLDIWTDEPYFLQGTIANYPRTSMSSDAEGAIVASNEGLSGRSGNRAIILITDAENSPTLDSMTRLWPGLASTAPRIFAVNIAGSTDAVHAQDLMQDWSLVNSGNYVYVRNQGEMDVAFDRAATELRRPSIYTISAQTSLLQPTPTPEPSPTPAADGSLQVMAPVPVEGQPPVLPASQEGNVAIILDTSGSMLQGLGASTRADIAKTALIDLVTTTIPAGTNVSLRTFGDTPDSCETILMVPMSPLDPAAMSQTITNLPIVNLVKTPIGASLEAVINDLGPGDGPKIVVLVTDGEETCGGDAAAAIRALVATGIDVRVNIVGFAIDDPALSAQFSEWAALGNGQYIDAGNAEELNQAVARAVLPTFDVLDANGTVVASGQVGSEPIAVPPGTYRVIIRSNPEVVIDNVVITSGQTTELPIP